MRVSTKRILSIGLSFVFMIAAILVYFQLIVPEAEVITKKRSEVASKEQLFLNQQEAVNQVQNLIAQFKNLSRLQSTVSLAMPSGQETIGAIRQVQAVAATARVSLNSLDFKRLGGGKAAAVKPSDQSLVRPLQTVQITMTASGDYEGLKKFVQLLESSVRVANVVAFKYTPAPLRPAGTGPNPAAAADTLNLTVDVYYQDVQS